MNRCFLLLLSLNAANASVGQTVLAKIKRDIDANATPAWIDSRGVGVLISTAVSSRELWTTAFGDLPTGAAQTMRDALLLQIGPDWQGFPESKAGAWLNGRFPMRM